MLPDGTLESWDMLVTLPFGEEARPTKDPESTTFKPIGPQKRQGSADIPEAMQFMAESLLDNQGYFIRTEGNASRIWLPYALSAYLNKGDEYVNLDNGETYVIKEVEYVTDSQGRKLKNGVIILSNKNGGPAAPKRWHRLRPKNHIRFMDAFPKTLSQPYQFDPPTSDGSMPALSVPAINDQGERAPWFDTITWHTIRREPGGLQKPFSDPREIKPRHREVMRSSKTDNCDYLHFVEGQLFDNIIQFDIWAQTNERAEALAVWFQDFFERYVWVWKWNGVKEILFWQQNADAIVTRWRNDIVSRSIQLYFQTERLRNFPVRRIVDISVAIETLVDGEHLQPPEVVIDPTACVDPTGVIPIEILDGPGISLSQ